MDKDMFLLVVICVVAIFSGYILDRIVLLRKQVKGKLDSLESCYDDLSGKVGLLESKEQDIRDHLNKNIDQSFSAVSMWTVYLSGQCKYHGMRIDEYVSVYMKLDNLRSDQIRAINIIRDREKK